MAENEQKSQGVVASTGLSQRQINAIMAILRYASIEKAARNAHISRTILYEWLKNEMFLEELKSQRKRIVDANIHSLISSGQKAIAKLDELLETNDKYLLRLVCKDVIDLSFRGIEIRRWMDRYEKAEKLGKKISEQRKGQ